MSKAMELAEEYSDAVSAHRLESLYGTSKSYTLLKAKDRDEAHEALSAELRRLAAVEAAALAFVAGAQKEFAPKEFKALQDALGETK